MSAPSLPEALSREIERVARTRAQYEYVAGLPNVNVAPAIAFMDAAIYEAHQALGGGDALEMVRALQLLRDFQE